MTKRPGAGHLLVAVTLHAPGLYVLGYRIGPRTARINALALLVTLAAVGALLFFGRLFWAATTFALGHLVWSAYLARAVRTGEAER